MSFTDWDLWRHVAVLSHVNCRKAGKAAHSDAVIANAWQHRYMRPPFSPFTIVVNNIFYRLFVCVIVHRADVSTSLAVFVGLLGSMAGYPILDPLAGLLVAGLIVRQVRLNDCVFLPRGFVEQNIIWSAR